MALTPTSGGVSHTLMTPRVTLFGVSQHMIVKVAIFHLRGIEAIEIRVVSKRIVMEFMYFHQGWKFRVAE